MRRDLRLLCWMLRHELLRDGHADVWRDLAQLRALAQRHEDGDLAAARELSPLFRDVPRERLDLLLRILGIFFDLANISEDLQRERVLRQRRQEGRLEDGFSKRLQQLASSMKEPERSKLLGNLEAEFVFTAHPTEAKRQAGRRILDRIRTRLRRLEQAPRGQRKLLLSGIHEELRALLRTDPLHPHRPEVLEELDRALFVGDALWQAVPGLIAPVDRLLPGHRPLRFGCWIGGDRDGHPHVTVDISRETLKRLRQRAKDFHLSTAKELWEQLTMLCRETQAIELLKQVLPAEYPADLEKRLARVHPEEYFRRALICIQYRIEQDLYRGSSELERDLNLLEQAMRADQLEGSALRDLQRWIRRSRVFGLSFMRLDIRENSKGYRTLMKELLALFGEETERVDRDDLEGLWNREWQEPSAESLSEALSERSLDLLQVTRLMQEWGRDHGEEGVGVNIISMTHCVGDVLWVLWLQRLCASWSGGQAMNIAPLFETIDDLQSSADMLQELFRHPVYRDVLKRQGNRQTVMVGYSDSAKDGGYLAACWALYEGQERMQELADGEGVELTCFHGRGGALGRGGGPAARAIQALPPSPGDAHIRMTEQGEVIADRFIDPALAQRHMEQILGGLLLHSAENKTLRPEWRECMEAFATHGRDSYLQLFEHPGFTTYFREATPIDCIEGLPIGSRPSRRHGAKSIEDLRAIPYTFSWTQSRQLINAFYGLGSAWESLSRKQRLLCLDMYREWPFFRSMIDNAELAMTKCDGVIAGEYAKLMKDPELSQELGSKVQAEMDRTKVAILTLTEKPSLMADSAWLRRSVEIRKPFIDVLNHIQIELLKRQRALETPDPDLQRSLRLSVQGIAAGLRTTG